MTSWREEQRPVRRTPRIDLEELRRRRGDELQVLDVRERSEWDAGHIPGSLFCPYHDIGELPEGLDPERPVAVICASGQRSAVGASLLERLGARDVIHVVDGGVAQYLAAAAPRPPQLWGARRLWPMWPKPVAAPARATATAAVDQRFSQRSPAPRCSASAPPTSRAR